MTFEHGRPDDVWILTAVPGFPGGFQVFRLAYQFWEMGAFVLFLEVMRGMEKYVNLLISY